MAAILSALLLAGSALAQDFVPTPVRRQAPGATASPLTDYHFSYSNVPYQVNPFPVGRGPQSGYNICNSTTEGPNSQCQTMFVNSIDDFCIWGSPTANGVIGNVEAAVVAYCTKPGHGTRVMPAGTLKGVQFVKTSGYIQVAGVINQAGIGLDPTDGGGELDPHGADLAGNPLGGLVFSNSLPSANGVITQGDNWSNFVGGGTFCIKVCDNSVTSPDYCQNIYDLIGCAYNMPSSAYNTTTFTSCESDLQIQPGLYVSNGQTLTWSQPATLSPNSVLPWQPSIPASSSCTTYQSSSIYAQETGSVGASTTASGSKATGKSSGSSPTASGAKPTGSSNGARPAYGTCASSIIAAFAAAFILLA